MRPFAYDKHVCFPGSPFAPPSSGVCNSTGAYMLIYSRVGRPVLRECAPPAALRIAIAAANKERAEQACAGEEEHGEPGRILSRGLHSRWRRMEMKVSHGRAPYCGIGRRRWDGQPRRVL